MPGLWPHLCSGGLTNASPTGWRLKERCYRVVIEWLQVNVMYRMKEVCLDDERKILGIMNGVVGADKCWPAGERRRGTA